MGINEVFGRVREDKFVSVRHPQTCRVQKAAQK